jgi:hypothetical protein
MSLGRCAFEACAQFIAGLAVLIFLPAWTLRYRQRWLLLAVFTGQHGAVTLYFQAPDGADALPPGARHLLTGVLTGIFQDENTPPSGRRRGVRSGASARLPELRFRLFFGCVSGHRPMIRSMVSAM